MLYHLLAPLGKHYLIFNLSQLHQLSGGGRDGHRAAHGLPRRAGDHRAAPSPEDRTGHPGRGAREPPGQARHADDGRPDHPALRPSFPRCSGPGSTTASSWSRCWPPSGWARSVSSTTISRSCRESRAGLVAKWKLVGQVSFGLALGLLPDLLPGGAAGDHAGHCHHRSLLQVRGRHFRAVALRRCS